MHGSSLRMVRKRSINDIDLIIDLPLVDRLLEFERGTQLFYGNGVTRELSIQVFDAESSKRDFLSNSDHKVVRVHSMGGTETFTLDLCSGIITNALSSSVWNFINPHLPTAPEFEDL